MTKRETNIIDIMGRGSSVKMQPLEVYYKLPSMSLLPVFIQQYYTAAVSCFLFFCMQVAVRGYKLYKDLTPGTIYKLTN